MNKHVEKNTPIKTFLFRRIPFCFRTLMQGHKSKLAIIQLNPNRIHFLGGILSSETLITKAILKTSNSYSFPKNEKPD